MSEKKKDHRPINKRPEKDPAPLIEGEDFYFEKGLMVLTKKYHLKRGYCCNSGCRHCPYSNPE
ncbi:MAG: hypothetical protein HRT44_02965 [Bdellovibrionales bacterium]|nr:DUF5522 domain-containing protein [Bdellovibrionales bacterium]NQZ18207.1 hypothetical protein [Bdellovibrionales bacterium]